MPLSPPPVSEKTCNKCGRTLPLSAFALRKASKDGHQACCLDCTRRIAKEYRERKARKAGITSLPAGANPALSAFTPRQLIEELRSRGYKGTLTYTHEIKL